MNDLIALHASMGANMLTHMSYFQAAHPAMTVEQRPDLTIIDSGLACDTFNFICRARLSPETASEQISEAVGHFQKVNRPFSWWVGPADEPEALSEMLIAAGLVGAESELGMAMDLTKLRPDSNATGLRIEQVSTPQQLADYASVLAALRDSPDSNVVTFYERVSEIALTADCPMHFYIGYVDDQPVASSELCLAAGVAGLYNIATLATHRRKGYGTALTLRPLIDARAAGVTVATLQASVDGQSVYARIGFEPTGQFTEYQPVG